MTTRAEQIETAAQELLAWAKRNHEFVAARDFVRDLDAAIALPPDAPHSAARESALEEARDAMMYALARLPPVGPAKLAKRNKDGKPHSSRVRMMRALATIGRVLPFEAP